IGLTMINARRYDEAITQLKRAVALDPGFPLSHFALGTAYDAKGMREDAIASYRKALSIFADANTKAMLARALAKSGQRGEAIRLRDQVIQESSRSYVGAEYLAIIYGALGDKDSAFASLEKAFAARSPFAILFAVDPAYDDLRDDPRFGSLLRRAGLPQ